MAGTRTSGLAALATVADSDVMPIVDVSDTSMAPTGTTKKLTAAILADYIFNILTTTGDIMYASAANTPVRLAIGAATTVLHGGTTPSYSQIVAGDIASNAVTTVKILDANVTTAKIADKAVTGPKMQPALCQVKQSAAQSFTNNTQAAMLFDTEDLDALTWHSTGSNTDRITPTIAGWYRATVAFDWQTDTDYTRRLVEFAKNGAAFTNPAYRHDLGTGTIPTGPQSGQVISPLIQCNGSTDYITATALQINTSTGANTCRAVFLVELVSPT